VFVRHGDRDPRLVGTLQVFARAAEIVKRRNPSPSHSLFRLKVVTTSAQVVLDPVAVITVRIRRFGSARGNRHPAVAGGTAIGKRELSIDVVRWTQREIA